MPDFSSSYFPGVGEGKLIDAMNGVDVPGLRYAPRGIGHGLIGFGIALLVYGVLFANATASHPVILLDDVTSADVVPGEAFTIGVPGPGQYELFSTVRHVRTDVGTAPIRSENYQTARSSRFTTSEIPDEARYFYGNATAVARDGGWVVASPAWPYPSGTTDRGAMWAVPVDNAPLGMHVPTFVRDVVIAVIGGVMLVVGLILRTRFVRAVRRYAESIEHPPPPRSVAEITRPVNTGGLRR